MAENPLNKSTQESKSAEGSNIEVGNIEVGGDVYGNIIVGHGNIINQIINFFQGDTKAQIERRNRRVMLDHVENFWVKGVLEKSLHGAALLELGIKEDTGAVNYPWTIKKESTDETLPAGKSMLEIFQEIGMGRSLLILGAPGAGKTTMLLELARQLIERARDDEAEPIPVVFNLASWTEKQTLPDWLAEQLNIVYYVPKKIAPSWVEGNKMLLLLDGLDEVKQDSRAKCVEAINQFRNEYGLTSLVVCSRIEEYAAINTKLLFQGAISLQPLTSKQIKAYFDRLGKSLASVKQLLKKDKPLQQLAETPLMLSIMALAYKDRKADELTPSNRIEDQRKNLFNTYIDRMFERPPRSAEVPFTKPQTLHYLSWLASTMIRQNLITCQIESLQPSWLEKQSQGRLYPVYVGLIGVLFVGLFGVLLAGLFGGLSGRLIFGLIFGLVTGLLSRRSLDPSYRSMILNRVKWSWKEARRGLILGLILGLIFGLLVGRSGDWSIGLLVVLYCGLLGGLIGGLIGGRIDELRGRLSGKRSVDPTNRSIMLDRLKWSWKEARRGLILGLIFGLSWGIGFGIGFGLIFGLILGLFVGLGVWLSFGLTSEQVEETTYAGQRLKQTLLNGLFYALINGLSVGFLAGLFSGLIRGRIGELIGGLGGGLSIGLSAGLLAGLIGGYLPLIQHFSLRLVLAQDDLLPRQLIAFLEYCVRLIFLRRVGGSYIFVHRLLMEHFAEMDV